MSLNLGIISSSRAQGAPLLLDTYPNAAAAYSLRKLRNAYSGAAIRVRRDLDNTEQDIGFDANGNLNTTALQTFVGSENYVYYSQDFTQSGVTAWTKTETTITANAGIAPDGTNTANNCVIAANSNVKAIYQPLTSVSTRDYVFSIYAKANQYNYAQLLAIRDSTNRYSIIVDLTTGLITQTNTAGTPNFVNSSVTPVGNGWYRISITLNINLGFNYFAFSPSPVANPTLNASLDMLSAGNGTSGVFFWGAQLNYFSLKPYQVTTTAHRVLCSGFVTTWYDQSGNARNATQSTLANQPQIVNTGSIIIINGKPSLQVDTTDFLTLTSSLTIPIRTTFSVIQRSASNVSFFAYGGGLSHYWYQDGKIYFDTDSGYWGSTDASSSQSVISGYNSSSNVMAQYINNTLLTSVKNSQVFANAISCLFSYNGSSLFSNGYGQEFIIYSTNKSSDLSLINTNINSYYSIYTPRWAGNGTALLDLYPSAAGAYSLRNLSSTYTGPLVRVRRSSDNAEMDIYGTVAGQLDTVGLLNFVGAGNGFIRTWYDQSGNGRNAITPTSGGSSGNLFVSGGVINYVNGKPAFKLDATPSLFLDIPTGFLNNATNFSFQFVVNIDNTTGENAALFGPGASSFNTGIEILNLSNFGNRTALRLNGTLRNNNAGEAYQLWNDNTQTLTEIYGNTASTSAYKNNASVTLTDSSATPTLNFNGVYNINSYGGSIGVSSKGFLQEMIIYSSNQLSNRTGIQNNINSFYTIY
jgi:hypothetical protein